MRLPAAILALALPLAAAAHQEVQRPLGSIDAELVAVGRVVHVVADRGSQGPCLVTVVIDRLLDGEAPGQAITFRAPPEHHGPGWQVGYQGLVLLDRHEGGWQAAATAAEMAAASQGGDPAAAWRNARAEAAPTSEPSPRQAGPTPAPAQQAPPTKEAPARGLPLSGLAAGALFAVALLFLGAMKLRRLPGGLRHQPISGGPVRPCQMPRPAPPPGSPRVRRPRP